MMNGPSRVEDHRYFGIFIEIPVKSYCKYNTVNGDFAGIWGNIDDLQVAMDRSSSPSGRILLVFFLARL